MPEISYLSNTPRPIETPVTRYKHRINVIVTPVNGRFAQNVLLRRPYQIRILLLLCLQINISAKLKSLIGDYMICFTMYVSMYSDLYLISTNIRSEVGATVSAIST